jgi:hypothetical protein
MATSISSGKCRDRTGCGITLCSRAVPGAIEVKMAVAIGLFIFAVVIGSHLFLWWSCYRNGGL